jgi:UPF0755 protein
MTKKSKIIKRVCLILGIILLLIVIAGAGAVIWYQNNISAFYDSSCTGDECKLQTVTIAQGEGAQQIAEKLEQAGLIKSAFAFRIYLTLQAENKNLLPGEYQFSKKMSVEQIVKSLNAGVVARTVRLTFLPGETIRATRKRLIDAGFKDTEVDAALTKQYDHELLRTKPADASLEGYIWGDTYEFYADESVEKILTTLFDHMLKVVKEENLIAKYQQRGFTLHEGITLASVIQREAPSSYEEKRHIAQVFETRLQNGIVLGSDAIIAYAADQINPDRDKTDMSYLNTIECPWNSRRCKGLPPTPISTPNRDSLKAVAEPTSTSDYYFLTGDDGNMYYAQTEAGHNDNIKKYCQKLCQIL